MASITTNGELERNPSLRHSYSLPDLSGKLINKTDLQAELGLPVNESVPLFGSVGRLVEQKGVDILIGALEEILSADLQVASLEQARRFSNRMRRSRATLSLKDVGPDRV